MSDAALLTNFNFDVFILVPGQPEWKLGFAECDGLEASMTPTTIREGGNNGAEIHLPGQASYGQVTLRRGVASGAPQLWSWWEMSALSAWSAGVRLPAQVTIQAHSADRTRSVSWTLSNALPLRVRGPALSATDARVAIEELQIGYEFLFRLDVALP